MPAPLCFVLMPFGKKPTNSGAVVDFDAVYQNLIAPAIKEAGLEPLRADEEMTGGIIHKPMFERLILCEYAIADLTTVNANVFYELGVRHAVRPQSTLLLFAKDSGQLPFDVAPLRALPYELAGDGKPTNIDTSRAQIVAQLVEARKAIPDSPVFTLVEGFSDVDHTKTDVFREQVEYSSKLKDELAIARKEGREALHAIEQKLNPLHDAESGVVIDLFLSYRSVKAWDDMIRLVKQMSPPLAATVLIQEQLGLALNRAHHGEEAEKVLLDVIAKRGPSSETYGILGRVYKDRWEAALKADDTFLARGFLEKAIDAYLKGFEADWRDAYPGINAVTLMELKDPPDPRQAAVLPVVRYAVERRIAAGKPDYWDYATQVELAVLAKDEDQAMSALAHTLAAVRETWEPETTARNLRLIREARERRGMTLPWTTSIETELNNIQKNK